MRGALWSRRECRKQTLADDLADDLGPDEVEKKKRRIGRYNTHSTHTTQQHMHHMLVRMACWVGVGRSTGVELKGVLRGGNEVPGVETNTQGKEQRWAVVEQRWAARGGVYGSTRGGRTKLYK